MSFSAKGKEAEQQTERSQEMQGRLNRVRRKSRNLEMDLFGCLLSDMGNLKAAFDSVDTDGSGRIDSSELQEAMKKAGRSMSIEECKRMIKKVDQDNDGELSFEEFRLIFTGKTPPAFRADNYKPTSQESPSADGMASEGTFKYNAETESLRYSFTPRGERPQ